MQPKNGQNSRWTFPSFLLVHAERYLAAYLKMGLRLIKEHARIHQSLVVLTLFVLLNNFIMVNAANAAPELVSAHIVSDPYQIADTVRLLADYTPTIEEDPDALAFALEEQVNGTYIATNELVPLQPSQVDESSASSDNASSSERIKDIKYTVQIGDTLSGIGSKFNLKLATLKVKNNLNDIDSLKPGNELTIPPQDLSEKAIQAAEERKKASANLASATSAKSKNKLLASAKSNAVGGGNFGLIIPLSHKGVSRGVIAGVHDGIDYRADMGTTVFAAGGGTVVSSDESGWNGGYGKTIVIARGNMTMRYAHLSDANVSPGQQVEQGQAIGRSGNSGRSTGPHLHFEVRVNGRIVNPY